MSILLSKLAEYLVGSQEIGMAADDVVSKFLISY